MATAFRTTPAATAPALPRLAAFDIDGTLITRDAVLADRTAAALEALAEAGVMTVLATGRPWPQTTGVVRRARLLSYAVCLNGAVVMDIATGERIADRSMTHTEAIEAAEVARKLLPDVHLGVDLADGRHLWEHDFAPAMPSDLLADLQMSRVDDAIAAVDGPVLTWLVHSPSTQTLSVVNELASEMPLGTEIRPSGLEMAEIAAAGVNKSTGLEIICQRYGIQPADVVAFGDGLNDVDMLRWAGRSVAMSNAPAELHAAADVIAPSNEAEGVAAVVEAMLAGAAWPPAVSDGSFAAASPCAGSDG